MLRPSAFRSLSFTACLAFSASVVFSESGSGSGSVFTVRKAVFSDRQFFWPQLAGQGRPALPEAPAPAVKARSGPKAAGGTQSSGAARIAILPVTLKDYRESLPCDSCHRLSANGMEFFLENYLKEGFFLIPIYLV